MDEAYRALVDSDRVSSQTRAVLLERTYPPAWPSSSGALTTGQRRTLLAAIGRIVPSTAMSSEALAARLEAVLAANTGDGWRFARLPSDRAAMAAGLETLEHLARASDEAGFAEVAPSAQDALLRRMQDGATDGQPLSGKQMKLWFDDVRAAIAQLYVSHPDTLAKIGYSGIANGGDGPVLKGFTLIGLGEREDWEPEPQSEQAR